MVEAKINKKELEQMLKDQLRCNKIKWDEDGNAIVEIDFDKLKERETIVEKHDHYYYRNSPWMWNTCEIKQNSIDNDFTLCYNKI